MVVLVTGCGFSFCSNWAQTFPTAPDRACVLPPSWREVLGSASGLPAYTFRGGLLRFLERPRSCAAALHLLRRCPGLERATWGEETGHRLHATVRRLRLLLSVHQFWVSDQSGPRDDAVRQPDVGSSLRVWRPGCLLGHSGLSAAGHLEDAFCCSGRTQGRRWVTKMYSLFSFYFLTIIFVQKWLQCKQHTRVFSLWLHLSSQVYSNLRHAVSTMCSTEGALTFYRGLSPTLLAVFPYAGLQFFSYNIFRRLLAPPPTAPDSGGQWTRKPSPLGFGGPGPWFVLPPGKVTCGACCVAPPPEWSAKPSRIPWTSSRRGCRWGASRQPGFSLDG